MGLTVHELCKLLIYRKPLCNIYNILLPPDLMNFDDETPIQKIIFSSTYNIKKIQGVNLSFLEFFWADFFQVNFFLAL